MTDRTTRDLLAHLERISRDFRPKTGKVIACITGGVAVAHYTGARMSDDTDIDWSHRVLLPREQQHFLTAGPEGNPALVTIDAGFSDSLGLFHPDWKKDASIIAEFPTLIVKIINPVDLIVSKIGRFVERDRDDIRAIATAIPVDPDVVRLRAEEAIDYYVGSEDQVRTSLDLALDIIRECRKDGPSCGS